jgi:hypothetical protein
MPNTVEDYIAKISELARTLVEGTDRPYDVGMRLLSLGMQSGIDSPGDISNPICLIWGSLTDLVDGPRGDEPGAEEKASALMIRAAREWLAISSNEASRRAYFDRWVYEECGYRRPSSRCDR